MVSHVVTGQWRRPVVDGFFLQGAMTSSLTLEINHGVFCRANAILGASKAARHYTSVISFSQQAQMTSRYLQFLWLLRFEVLMRVKHWLTPNFRLGWPVQRPGLQVLLRRWHCWMSCTSTAKVDPGIGWNKLVSRSSPRFIIHRPIKILWRTVP